MPKRIIDGDALWASDKLAQVQPARYRAEYANLLPLALANGTFECNPGNVWRMVYGYNREDITRKDVVKILDEFQRVKMLFRWTGEDGKTWGYWVGISKEGRLPKGTDYAHAKKGEAVPLEKLAEFLGEPWPSKDDPDMTSQRPEDARLGIGTGNGTGSGMGMGPGTGSGIGSGIGAGSSPIRDEQNRGLSTSVPQNQKQNQNNSTSTQNTSALGLKDLLNLFHDLVVENPHAQEPPDNWFELYEQDIKKLLLIYPKEGLKKILEASQQGNWAKYIKRSKPLLDGKPPNHEKIAEQIGVKPWRSYGAPGFVSDAASDMYSRHFEKYDK